MELTNEQWQVVAPLLPPGKSGSGLRGRPRRENREVLEGILWVLRTGARWKDLPPEFPPYQTCHRRFGERVAASALQGALKALVRDMESRGGIDLSEAFIDGTFAGAKRGPWRWSNKAQQGLQDHGNCGPPWSSCRHLGWKRFAK